MGQPPDRIGEVERYIGRARPQDADDRGDQVHRPGGGDPHQITGPDTASAQSRRDRAGSGIQFGIGQRHLSRRHRDRIRMGCSGIGEYPGQRRLCVRGGGHRRGQPCQHRPVAVGQDIDVTDGHRRIGGQRIQNTDEPFGEDHHRRTVEQVGRIAERTVPQTRTRPRNQGHRQITLRRPLPRIHGTDLDPGQGEVQIGQVTGRIERQHHLGERFVRLSGMRHQLLDDVLERHVRMREGVEVGGFDTVQQLVHRQFRGHRRTQYECVHEHTHDRIERRLAAAGDGCGDGDIPGCAEPGEQHGQTGMHHHERCDPPPACQRIDPAADRNGYLESDAVAPPGRDRRARPVRGEFENIGYPRQLLAPIPELATDDRIHVVDGAEHLALPDRIVRHLDRERFDVGHRAARPCAVRRQQVRHQRRQRFTVGGDVVHDDRQQMFGDPGPADADPDRPVRGYIESAADRLIDPGPILDHRPIKLPCNRFRVRDDLAGLVVAGRIPSA